MALFRGIQEYIALDANNITLVFDLLLLASRAIYSCIPLKAIQYYINIWLNYIQMKHIQLVSFNIYA